MTRAEAQAIGAATYFEGIPCRAGHVAPRRVSNRTCVECLRLSAMRWRQKNPELVIENWQRWYATNAESERQKKLARFYERRTECLEANKLWHRENAEFHKKRCRQWREANPEAKRAYDHIRRARKAASGGKFSPSDIRRIFNAQRGRCAYCAVPLKRSFHRDHVMPLALRGENTARNIQLTCKPCNQSKGSKHPIAFAQERGLLI